MGKSPREQVLEYYPNAIAKNIGTKSGGNFYHIMDGERYLGKGKSKQAAWKSASRNM